MAEISILLGVYLAAYIFFRRKYKNKIHRIDVKIRATQFVRKYYALKRLAG